MKKIYCVIFMIFVLSFHSIGQDDSHKEKLKFEAEIDCLNNALKDSLFFFDSLSNVMNAMLNFDTEKNKKDAFNAFSDTLKKIEGKLDSLNKKPESCLCLIIDSSFKIEYKNYLTAIRLLALEAKKVGNKNSALPYLNYRNAYYNLLKAKSQFKEGLNEYLSVLNTKVATIELSKSLQEATNDVKKVRDSVDTTLNRTRRMLPEIEEVNSNSKEMKEILNSSFETYFEFSPKGDFKKYEKTDKINTGINTVLYDARRNNWWRAALGGVAGGLAAGLIIGMFK